MAESTKTLTQLRRKIGLALQMPFYRRYANGYLETEAGSTASKVKNASLSQADKFWNGMWFYNKTTQENSLIRSFASNDNTFFLEVSQATATTGDDFEILTGWSAIEVHSVINNAITQVGRSFPYTVTDQTLVLEEKQMEYDISGLTSKPWIVTKLFIESRGSIQRGTLVSATGTTFTAESSNLFSNVVTDADWRVSIYAGTGRGQIRTLVSHTGAQGTVAAWTIAPDSTSKYAFWNANEDLNSWIPYDNYRLDNKEFPSTLYMYSNLESHYGLRILLEYMSVPTELSLETDTTIIPEDYIKPYAIHLLYKQKVPHTKADKDVYYAQAESYLKDAEDYLANNRPTRPDVSLRSPSRNQTIRSGENPLSWE